MTANIALIANAPGHRAHEVVQGVVSEAEWVVTFPEVAHINVDAGDEWVCDLCNGTITIIRNDGPADPAKTYPSGQLALVPVVEGYALCDTCMTDADSLPHLRNWPICSCPPCQDAASGVDWRSGVPA